GRVPGRGSDREQIIATRSGAAVSECPAIAKRIGPLSATPISARPPRRLAPPPARTGLAGRDDHDATRVHLLADRALSTRPISVDVFCSAEGGALRGGRSSLGKSARLAALASRRNERTTAAAVYPSHSYPWSRRPPVARPGRRAVAPRRSG